MANAVQVTYEKGKLYDLNLLVSGERLYQASKP
jgi:hypothetical protein